MNKLIDKSLSVVVWVLLSFGGAVFSTSAFSETIQGRVSLPDSRVAPAGGMVVDVFGFDSVESGFDLVSVTIPQGQSFVDYTLTVTGTANSVWNVEFFCFSNCDDYVDSIYYAAAGTVYSSFQADSFASGQNYTGVDISLVLANLISGEVFLPSPDTASAGGVNLEISVSNASGNAFYFVSDLVVIAEGASTTSYGVKIPIGFLDDFIVEYNCFGNCDGYVNLARYSITGSTVSFDLASRFTSGSDYPNTDIDVLPAIEISGSVSLPVGDVAPAGGVSFFLRAEEIGGNFGLTSINVDIPAGESEAGYVIGIPPDAFSNWIVSYQCSVNCDGYFERGYYNSTATVATQDDATQINGAANSSNIDLDVLEVNILSGTISLPNGLVAPVGGTMINVNGNTDGFTGATGQSVVIPAGSNSVNYALDIPANSTDNWRIQFSCNQGCDGIVQSVFYATDGAKVEFSDATLVPGGNDVAGLDITLIRGTIVSGTIALPTGEVAPGGGIRIQIDVSSSDFRIFGGDFVTITEGENSTSFETVTVPDSSAELGVQYRCVGSFGAGSDCPGYSAFGYYTTSGTVASAPDATLLAGDQDHFNIDLTLIPAIQVSGDVTLPDGMVAPAGGIELGITGVRVQTDPMDFSNDGVFANAVIPEGEISASYTLDIPQDAGIDWFVTYACFNNCGILFERGYYSDTGTVFSEDQAASVSGQGNQDGIDMDLFVANVIEGAVSLPSAIVAPMGGVTFDVTLRGNRISSDQLLRGDYLPDLLIPEGQNSQDYSFKISPDTDAEWHVNYICFDDSCDGYTNEGYYSNVATVPVFSEATAIPGGVDSSGIDLVFLTANTVSGTVTIPDGLNISGDDLYFEVFVYDRNRPMDGFYESLGRAFFGMNGPITSFDYSAPVFEDPSADLFVGVVCFDFSLDGSGPCDVFVNNTFYGDPISEFNEANAVSLLGGQDHSGIDVLLIESDVISGTVSLPSGVAPADGVEINVAAFESDAPFNFGDSFLISIPEGESSANYKLRVPQDLPANNWIVEAECRNNCDNYELSNYYGSAGTTTIRTQATRLANTGPHQNIDIALLPASMLTTFTCDVLLDDFSGETLDLDNWRDPEFSGEIIDDKVLIKQKLISSRARSTFGESRRFNLNLLTLPASISADVELVETDLTDSGVGSAFASVRGSFYYTLNDAADYDENLGEVAANVEIGDRGNGLEAWYQIFESTDSGFESVITHVDEILIPPGTIVLGTTYTLGMNYNAATGEFTFSVDAVSATATGPAVGSAVVPDTSLFRGFTAGVIPEDNEDSDPISVAANFDNIMADGVLVDDFSASTLDEAVWTQPIRSRNIDQGKLRTVLTSTSTSRQSIFTSAQPSEYANASCIQATLGIDSTSEIPANARGRNRVDGYWFNALYDGSSGSEYNGYEGTVYAQVALEKIEDGSVRGALYAEQGSGANFNSGSELVFHIFSTPAALDEEFIVAIKLDEENNRLLFRFADEVFALPISTDIKPVEPSIDYVGLTTRIRDGVGQINATVDDVYITRRPDPVEPPAVEEEMCFPIVGRTGTAVICL